MSPQSNLNSQQDISQFFTAYAGKDKSGCLHDGLTPVKLAGKDIWLGGQPKLTADAIKACDLLVGLTGFLPTKMPWGISVPFMNMEMKDYGGVPTNWDSVIKGLGNLIIKKNRKVLLYCYGSHGRTGCVYASLIAVFEPEVADPIEEARTRHCDHAVESLAQAEAIFELKGQELPEKYKEEFKPKVSTTTQAYGPPQGSGGTVTGDLFGPKPLLPGGPNAEGKYFHHYGCNCTAQCDADYQAAPCECRTYQCTWNGKAKLYTHCKDCGCVSCNGGQTPEVINVPCSCPKHSGYWHHDGCACGKCSKKYSNVDIPCACPYAPKCGGLADHTVNTIFRKVAQPLAQTEEVDEDIKEVMAKCDANPKYLCGVPGQPGYGVHHPFCGCVQCILAQASVNPCEKAASDGCDCVDCVIEYISACRKTYFKHPTGCACTICDQVNKAWGDYVSAGA